MSQHAKQTYTIIDLFAGAGGLSKGFLQTERCEVIAAFESDQDARATYEKNHGNKITMCDDVEDALSDEMKEKIGSIDIIIGGPPCQGFSNANRQKNHTINQNNILVKKFVQAVLHLEPAAFVMENVSMLRSNTHRFFVDENDQGLIEKYNIPFEDSQILLLEEAFVFKGAKEIVKDLSRIEDYLWAEGDYLALNVVYKRRNNIAKLRTTIEKHKSKLINFADSYTDLPDKDDYIINQGDIAGKAIRKYFKGEQTEQTANDLCVSIEPAIIVQRMLSKAKEIYDNHIVVNDYDLERGLVAKVKTISVIDYVMYILGNKENGYSIKKDLLFAAAFGVPQKRKRLVVLGIKRDISEGLAMPQGSFNEDRFRTVKDAIKDIEDIETVFDVTEGDKGLAIGEPSAEISELGKLLRDSDTLYNHVVTETRSTALERFKAIKQGENFHSLPSKLKTTYSDTQRTQNTIYLRLKYDEPSGTVVNVRKSMWIHPTKDRAISIREAARLQTFPDSFIFCGTKDSQYQQIGNAVPPILSKAIAEHLVAHLDAHMPMISF